MKQSRILLLLILTGLTGMMTGCKEKVDLNNIDTRSQVNVSLASPLGTIRVAVSDVMLNAVGTNFVIGQDGVITYRDTSRFTMHLQDINWQKYAYQSHKKFHVDVTSLGIPGIESGISLPMELKLPLLFDFALEMKDINLNPEEERFDSILLDYIDLSSMIDQENMNLDWAWIDSIVIYLGPQCYRKAGSNYYVYKNDGSYEGYGFGKTLPSNVDNFSMCLMDDRSLAPGSGNVVDTVKMQLGIFVTVPPEEEIIIGNDAAILYDLDFQGLKHRAIWGYIKPQEDMAKITDTIDITGGWNIGEMLRDMKLPFAKPEFHFDITTQLAATWVMSCDKLYSTNSRGKEGWASFSGEQSWKKEFPNAIGLDASTIGQEATYSFKFDYTDSLGHLDNLFSINPELLIYQFGFDFADPEKYPQVRISSDADVNVEMQLELPMAFHPDLRITYRDTISAVDLTDIVSDAIEMKKANLYLVYDAYNEMPTDVSGTMYCLDEDGQQLDIFGNSLTFTALDSTKHVVEINEKDFDKLAATETFVLEFVVDDQTLRDKAELYPIYIKKEQVLQLQFGFVGNVDAVLNSNKK